LVVALAKSLRPLAMRSDRTAADNDVRMVAFVT